MEVDVFCTSLTECIDNFQPTHVFAMSSPLGGLGVLALAPRVKLTILTSGPVFNKLALLEAIDNFGAVVKYAPRIYTSIYKFVGRRECWVAGPPLVSAVAHGYSTSLAVYTCNKLEGVEKFFEGKPIESVSSRTLGGGRDGVDFDVVVKLRRLQVKGGDEEDVADGIIRSGIFDVGDLDTVPRLMWRIARRWRDRSVVVFRDPVAGLSLTIPLIYYMVKAVATGDDCPPGKCVKTTTKLVEKALRMAPQSALHEQWRQALRELQTRRRIEESPYIPAFLILTGRVEVKYDGAVRLYRLTSLQVSPRESA